MRDDVRKAVMVVILAALCRGPLAAAQPVPAEGRLDYAIIRSGDQIGTHTIAFRREGDRVVVDIAVDVQVRMLAVTVYRFNQRSSETWRDGRLLALDSTGNNDGTQFALRVREADGRLIAESRGRSTPFPADTIPTDVWNPAQLQRSTLMNSLEGNALPASVRDLGERTFTVQGRQVTARGSYLDATSEYQRSLWFDANGRLVHLEMHGRDGSLVEYRLR
jgi:hypothetical protein